MFIFVDSLFELLLEMVQVSGENKKDSLSEQLSSVVCRCLISLVVSLGDTGKMLAALAAMLTASGSLSNISVQVINAFRSYINLVLIV